MRNSAQEHEYDPNFVSKSQQKKAMDRLQAIGEQLAEWSTNQLKKLPISDGLRDALKELQLLKVMKLFVAINNWLANWCATKMKTRYYKHLINASNPT